MNQNLHRRVKEQYTEAQWDFLNKHIEFTEAWAADDLDRAQAIADRLMIGETKSIVKARRLKKRHDKIGEYL